MNNIKYSVLLLVILLQGCQFHYIENPGPQMSSSIEQSKANNVFISAYKAKSKRINGIKIDTVFAEKKYFSDGGFFSNYKIDSTRLQLILVTRDYLVRNGKGFGIDWTVEGFNPYSSKIAYRDYKQKMLSDSLVMEIDSLNNNGKLKVIGTFTLYKVK